MRRLQAKLTVGAVDDPLEREADGRRGGRARQRMPAPGTDLDRPAAAPQSPMRRVRHRGGGAAPKDAAEGAAAKGAQGAKDAGPDAGTATSGTPATAGGAKDARLSGFVTPEKYTGTLAGTNQYGFQLQPDNTQIKPSTRKGAKATLEVRWNEGGVTKRAKVEYEVVADPVLDTDRNSKKQIWRFNLPSTNTEPLLLSPEGNDHPTVLPARA